MRLEKDMIRILESFYDGIWITDGDGVVLYVNAANERITGAKSEDIVGKHSQELLDNKLFEKSAALQVLTTKKRETMMGYNYNTNKHVLITGNPIFNEEGKIKYVVNNVRDITDLENMAEELRNKQDIIDTQEVEIQRLKCFKSNIDTLEKYGIVAKSRNMIKVLDVAQRVGKFDSTVLILGESGSGKEIIAKTILNSGERSEQPFISVNCGAIPENLLESELFGYEKGAFTGANQKGKIGMFEMANNGIIFLDEIADLPLSLQVKILRVLQEKELMRIGGEKIIPLNVRVIAATNRDIEHMVSTGEFREDLYYRLNIVTISVPPLRKRLEDIPLLANLFLRKCNEKYKLDKVISPKVIDFFMEYPWPGNVRELENVIENIVILTQDQEIKMHHIPENILNTSKDKKNKIKINEIIPLKEAVELVEKDLIIQAMNKYGTTRGAASALMVNQSTIVRKMQKFKPKNV